MYICIPLSEFITESDAATSLDPFMPKIYQCHMLELTLTNFPLGHAHVLTGTNYQIMSRTSNSVSVNLYSPFPPAYSLPLRSRHCK